MTKKEQLEYLKQWYASNKSKLQTQHALIAAIKADSKVESMIQDLHLAVFNKSVSGCGNCLADAFVLLYKFPEEKMNQIENCKFKLRSGALLMDASNKLPMATAANLTDELAIAYLRDNINRKCMFAILPDNLDELLADKNEKAKGTPVETPTKNKTTKKK